MNEFENVHGKVAASMRIPSIACFWIGVCGLFHVALWARIMVIRIPKAPEALYLHNLAASKDDMNLRVTRAHGNYAENAPIFAIMLLLVDTCGVIPDYIIETSGLIFVAGRLLHAIGMNASKRVTLGRMIGSTLTLFSLANLAIQCLITTYMLSIVIDTFIYRFAGLLLASILSIVFAGKEVSTSAVARSNSCSNKKAD